MKTLSTLFPGTHLAEAVTQLEALYAEWEVAVTNWCGKSGLGCPGGCGICCSKFEPHSEQVEADYAALYINYIQPELFALIDRNREAAHCIFFDAAHAAHCTIYPARPLLCRLFAFSALTDKNETPEFHMCTYFAPDIHKRLYKGPEIEEHFHAPLPRMQEYSFRLYTINSGAAGASQLLRKGIIQALERVEMLKRLTGN